MPRIKKSVKEAKRKDLLQLAQDQLEVNSYHDITLDVIASKMGMSKSNLYHYFESKEQLYQEVFLVHFHEAVTQIGKRLETLRGCNDPQKVVEVIVAVSSQNRGLNDLGALFSTTLTRNISDQTIALYQDRFNHAALLLTKLILLCLPTLDVYQVEHFIDYFLAFKNGLWAEYASTEKYRQIVSSTNIRANFVPFETKLNSALLLIMKGLYAEKAQAIQPVSVAR